MDIHRRKHTHDIKTRRHRRLNIKPKPKCVQATIVMVATKPKHTQKPLLIPVDMNDPVLDGMPVLLHDKKTGTPSFTEGDMAVPPLTRKKKTRKNKKSTKKHKKKTKKVKTKSTSKNMPLHEYLKSFSIST